MAFNSYQSPPRRYNQANEAGWVQNLLGKTYGAVSTQTQRLPLITKIIAVSSFAAIIAQPIPNLLGTTLKSVPTPFSQTEWPNPQRRVSFRHPEVHRSVKTVSVYSLELEAGSYSITGADLTPLAGRAVNLESGSYALTGADLTPLAGRALNLEAGSYAITGADLTVAVDRSLDLEAGTYTITGADLTPLAGRALDLEAGTYATTGADVTFDYVPSAEAPFVQNDWPNPQRRIKFRHPGVFRSEKATVNAYSLNLESGSYALTGADVTFVYVPSAQAPFAKTDWPNPNPRPLNFAAYGYTVRLPEKQKPFLQHDWPNPYSKIRIAYRPPTMYRPDKPALNAYSLDLEAGSYVLSGAGATLDYSGTPTAYDLNLEAGTYVVTGADLTTLAARTLELEAGSYTVTGTVLTPIADRTLELEAGTYAITGADLTALVGRALNLEPGTYTITGATATLQGPLAISDGDEVQVLIAPDGIACTVLTDSGTTVKVVISSAKQIHVLTTGGAPIKVII